MDFSESWNIPIFAKFILSPTISTTSTVTALVAPNHIPGNEIELLNHLCVLVLTRSNGTLFDAASIQEEDIIELCIQLGQTCPKGLLQYSVAEVVLLFHSTDKMLVMVHGVIKAMASCEEPIRLRMAPPSTTHVRAYIAVRDGEPSGTQPPTPDREEELKPSPSDSHPDGRTSHQIQMDLGDAQLGQLMEDFCWEVTLRELNVSPGTYHQPPGEFQWETGTPRWMTRRGEGWEPRGQPPQPPACTQPDEGVGCLINTLTNR